MNIDERLKSVEQEFNDLSNKTAALNTQLNDIATEQAKLQGEYRLLKEMQEPTEAEIIEPKVKVKGK